MYKTISGDEILVIGDMIKVDDITFIYTKKDYDEET